MVGKGVRNSGRSRKLVLWRYGGGFGDGEGFSGRGGSTHRVGSEVGGVDPDLGHYWLWCRISDSAVGSESGGR